MMHGKSVEEMRRCAVRTGDRWSSGEKRNQPCCHRSENNYEDEINLPPVTILGGLSSNP